MPQRRFLPIALVAALSTACTWVKPDEAGSRVRVAYDGNATGCTKVGEIGVGVRDRLMPGVERNPLKVRDELESLARNEAAALGGDTIVAVDEPRGGEQRFIAYRCR
ncbi:MAG: DUF4156 domain-containing protein [Xanthomonadales bacterium]|nr:DUF4156 domain-containing protein [Xanthomonadales bacterium]